MTKHSSIVGGSTAERLLNCPGSYQATQALPKTADRPSEYAEEGTAMHEVMTRLMADRHVAELADLTFDGSGERYIGDTFHDRALTAEHIDDMIVPALNALDELEEIYGGGFRVAAIEMRVRFPGIPGAFGTADLLLVSDTWALMVDWKFGSGVGVKAVYTDEQGDRLNPQLAYYMRAAMKTKSIFFNRRKLAMAIIQPRADDALTHTATTRKELQMFAEDLENAVILAIEHSPPIKKGEWCRFAPCKVNCPLWTGPLLDLSKLGVVTRTAPDNDKVTRYAEYLARAKVLVDTVAMMKKEIDEQMLAYLEAGGSIPGWRLKLKAKNRVWADEDTVVKQLCNLGFKLEDVYQHKLQTFKHTDAVARKLGVTIPDELRPTPETNEVTLATTDDPAPVVDRGIAAEKFATALAKLTKA